MKFRTPLLKEPPPYMSYIGAIYTGIGIAILAVTVCAYTLLTADQPQDQPQNRRPPSALERTEK